MVSALDEQRSQIGVSFLRDVQLRLASSRVAPCRLQADITASIAALREPVRIFESEDVRQRYQRLYSMDLGQQ